LKEKSIRGENGAGGIAGGEITNGEMAEAEISNGEIIEAQIERGMTKREITRWEKGNDYRGKWKQEQHQKVKWY
jgi:TusA-related sulfurtransferase